MEDYAKGFYKSQAWKRCREAYIKSQGRLCERCLKAGRISPAEVVHHKVYISPANINNPAITLNWKNLEALCWACHEQEHKGRAKRYMVDQMGRVTGTD